MNTNMPKTQDGPLLDALLDSWDRNNTILVNLLRALPDGGMDARAADGSPTVAQLFMHIHYVRLVFVAEGGRTSVRRRGDRPGHVGCLDGQGQVVLA